MEKHIEIPFEVVADSRLTLETMRVLLVLFSFLDDETGTAIAGREDISKYCGMHPSNISEATTKLVELGWLVKKGNGGGSQYIRYSINIPNAVSEIAEAHKARSKKWKKETRRPNIPASVRQQVFERDAYRCVKCKSYLRLCVDHRHPYSLGGNNDLDNLQTLCWKCNSKKSNRIEVVE